MSLFSLNPRTLLTALAVALLATGGWYVHHLQATISEQQARLQTAEQREAALQDSVRELGSYNRAGEMRDLFGRYDLPGEVDAPEEVTEEGEVKEGTELTIRPGAAADDGQITPVIEDTLYVYYLDTAVGRYKVTGDIEVARRNGLLSYDLNVQGDPITFRTYKVESGGLRQTVADVPSNIQLTGLQTTYVPESYEEERRWHVRAPVVALRPELDAYFAYGAEFHYHTPTFLGASGFVETGLLIDNSQNVYPTIRGGVQF